MHSNFCFFAAEFNELPEVPFSAVWVCGPVLVQPGDVEDALGLSRQGGWIISEGFSIQNYNNNLDCDKVIPAGNQQYLVLHMWYLVSSPLVLLTNILYLVMSDIVPKIEYSINVLSRFFR